MATKKRLFGFDYQTFESFTRHMTKHREPYDQYDMGYVDAVDQIENWLEHNMVDAVEVVRCKDCVKRGNDEECPMLSIMQYTEADDFCSFSAKVDGNG